MQRRKSRAVCTDKRTQPGTDFASNFMENSVYQARVQGRMGPAEPWAIRSASVDIPRYRKGVSSLGLNNKYLGRSSTYYPFRLNTDPRNDAFNRFGSCFTRRASSGMSGCATSRLRARVRRETSVGERVARRAICYPSPC
jgi:hypothetical protein